MMEDEATIGLFRRSQPRRRVRVLSSVRLVARLQEVPCLQWVLLRAFGVCCWLFCSSALFAARLRRRTSFNQSTHDAPSPWLVVSVRGNELVRRSSELRTPNNTGTGQTNKKQQINKQEENEALG